MKRITVLSLFLFLCAHLSFAEDIQTTPQLPDGFYLASSSAERAYIDLSTKHQNDLKGVTYWRGEQICKISGYEGLIAEPESEVPGSTQDGSSIEIVTEPTDTFDAFVPGNGVFEKKTFLSERPYFYTDGTKPFYSESRQLNLTGVTVGAGIITTIGTVFCPPAVIVGTSLQCLAGACAGVCSYLRDSLSIRTGQVDWVEISYSNVLRLHDKGKHFKKIIINSRPKVPYLVFKNDFLKNCGKKTENGFNLDHYPISSFMKSLAGIH